ncbi:hypothetical protein DRQ53_03185 [bacterium]|nr:MAG: hypothetical protein DRQ32_06765 [bacterium]RKZ17538.1 MAG: hypothetical protein DRQ53_03185 [bacterium]
MSDARLREFATRYATAWSTQDPERFAVFYAEDGRLQINDGEPSVGRAAIAATAASYMVAFPDMIVALISVSFEDDRATFRWHWTGTNNGPGGTGRFVDMTGYEEWTFNGDGLIAESRGHLDQAEYDRQMGVEAEDEL